MAVLSRIAATLPRLLRRHQPRTAPVDAFGVVLAAASETGAVITIPGLAAWLGHETASDDADFMTSLASGFTESFEDYCDRISCKEVPHA